MRICDVPVRRAFLRLEECRRGSSDLVDLFEAVAEEWVKYAAERFVLNYFCDLNMHLLKKVQVKKGKIGESLSALR